MNMNNKSNARYKMRELRDSGSNANIKICFEVRATALRPRLHTEGYQLSTIGSSIQGPPLGNYNSTPEHTTPLYTITSTQEGAQSKERNTLGDHKDHKHSLGDLEGSQTIFSQNKDPKDRNRIDWLKCEKSKCSENKSQNT